MPPVERISTPMAASSLANETMPVLSDTEIRARWILMFVGLFEFRFGQYWLNPY